MIKMPKLSELTDLDKLKELGNSLMDNAVAGVDKVKATVGENTQVNELLGKVKSTINAATTRTEKSHDELHTQAASIKESLNALFEAQKQQVALMNMLKKQVNELLATAEQSTVAPSTTHAPAAPHHHSAAPHHVVSDVKHEPRDRS
jgi:hypothetical protein